jgi:hypothetical protein
MFEVCTSVLDHYCMLSCAMKLLCVSNDEYYMMLIFCFKLRPFNMLVLFRFLLCDVKHDDTSI